MKVAILAGGLGTRISEETGTRPKAMVEIGGQPILWHIMKYYYHFGYDDFFILTGYMGASIQSYVENLHEPWKVTVMDTGIETQTGGRVKAAEEHLKDGPFMLTYGDGLSNVNLAELEKFHLHSGKIMTLTRVQPEGRFGVLDLDGDRVKKFVEKPKGDGSWVNGGFFVCDPNIFQFLNDGNATILERTPMETLAEKGELISFKHENFWRPMDTLRDKLILEDLWKRNQAPWRVWN